MEDTKDVQLCVIAIFAECWNKAPSNALLKYVI